MTTTEIPETVLDALIERLTPLIERLVRQELAARLGRIAGDDE